MFFRLSAATVKTASYEKEYGEDYFQIQSDAIKKGQTVLVVDDIIATGESYKSGHVFVDSADT